MANDVDKAAHALRAALQWRADSEVDHILASPLLPSTDSALHAQLPSSPPSCSSASPPAGASSPSRTLPSLVRPVAGVEQCLSIVGEYRAFSSGHPAHETSAANRDGGADDADDADDADGADHGDGGNDAHSSAEGGGGGEESASNVADDNGQGLNSTRGDGREVEASQDKARSGSEVGAEAAMELGRLAPSKPRMVPAVADESAVGSEDGSRGPGPAPGAESAVPKLAFSSFLSATVPAPPPAIDGKRGALNDEGRAARTTLIETLLGSFVRLGDDLEGQPFFVFSAPKQHDFETAYAALGHATLSRFGVRCCEEVRVALLHESYRRGTPMQAFTLLLDLGPWAPTLTNLTEPTALLRLIKELCNLWSKYYPHRVNPLIVHGLPALTKLFWLARRLLPPDARDRMQVVGSDSELVLALEAHVSLEVIPWPLRCRTLAAQLAARQQRQPPPEGEVGAPSCAAPSADVPKGWSVPSEWPSANLSGLLQEPLASMGVLQERSQQLSQHAKLRVMEWVSMANEYVPRFSLSAGGPSPTSQLAASAHAAVGQPPAPPAVADPSADAVGATAKPAQDPNAANAIAHAASTTCSSSATLVPSAPPQPPAAAPCATATPQPWLPRRPSHPKLRPIVAADVDAPAGPAASYTYAGGGVPPDADVATGALEAHASDWSVFSVLLPLVLLAAYLAGIRGWPSLLLAPLWVGCSESHRLRLHQLLVRRAPTLPTAASQSPPRTEPHAQQPNPWGNLPPPAPPRHDWQVEPPRTFHSAESPWRSNSGRRTGALTNRSSRSGRHLPKRWLGADSGVPEDSGVREEGEQGRHLHAKRGQQSERGLDARGGRAAIGTRNPFSHPLGDDGSDGGEGSGGEGGEGGDADGADGDSGLGGAAYSWQEPAFFNEMWRRVWRQARDDYSRRLQRLVEKGISRLLEEDGYGSISARVDVGRVPWTFERMRMDGDDPKHIRADVWFEWCGDASLELSFDTEYISVPLLISNFSFRGPMRLQTTPQHYAPYLGHCSVSFLQPPQIDFTMRALRSKFDMMEVPLLAQRLKATAERACSPMVCSSRPPPTLIGP